MSRLFSKKKKTEYEDIELCRGVKILNQPEITCDDGRGVGRLAFDQRQERKRDLTRGRYGRKDSRGIMAKSILEMLIIGGSMCGLLSCIDIDYGALIILAACLVFSIYFCSLFKSGKTWVRDVGYVIFFAVFVAFILLFRRYVNSGFYAMVNEFLDHVTDYYGAQDVKVFSESISNRAVTVPIAAATICCVEIIVLNIFINARMSVFWAAWFSLPAFMVPLFFRFEPDGIYVFMVIAGLIGVICLNGNGHYRITDAESTFQYDEKRHRLSYRHSDRASFQLTACIMIVSVIIGGVIMILKPADSFLYRYKNSSVKNRIEEPLGNLIMYGFESLRNSANTGGLANGQLGGVSDVYIDGQTDLIVRFAPYSSDRIYLRSFVGDAYDWNHWSRDQENMYPAPDNMDAHPHGRMDVKNVDGTQGVEYYPYYSEYDSAIYDDDDGYYTYDYAPSALAEPVSDDPDPRYLAVPETNLKSVQKFCEKAGITELDSVDSKIQKVYIYFLENYPYTMHPGATPRDEDYVNYFLNTTKKGLCANYATAGALILRYLGIPTRYVEGYVIDYNEVLSGEILDDRKYDDYFSGYNDLGETAVVQVDVTDGGAHAWIEAFIHGRWQVVELTPPSNEEDDETTEDFWTRFGRWLSSDSGEDGVESTRGYTFSLGDNIWIVYIFIGGVILAISIFVVRLAAIKMIRIAGYHGDDASTNIVAYYRYMCDYARMVDADFDRAESHRAQLELFAPDMNERERKVLAESLELASYGPGSDTVTCEIMGKQLREIFRTYRKRVPVIKRIYIFRKL